MFPVDNLHLPLVAPVSVAAAAAVSSIPSLALWHACLIHASFSRVQQLASRGLLGSVSTENFDCVSCQLGKQPALPFNTSESISIDIFDLIHSDVWGPSSVSSIGGSQYFVIFVDDYSCYSWIFNMKHRSELLQVYSNFAKMVETQFSKRIKIFQFDNAFEYTQYAFQAILHSYGTIYQITCPGTFQQNGRAKRKLHHILDTVRALFLSAKVPAPVWGEATLQLFMLLIVFQVLSSKIKLHISTFLGHLQITTTFAPSVLLVSFFFSHVSITNLSLGQGFVVFLAMAKLKRGIGVMILFFIIFVSPAMLSFGNIASLSSSLTFVPPYLPPLS